MTKPWTENDAVAALSDTARAIEQLAAVVPDRAPLIDETANSDRAELPIQNLPAHLQFARHWETKRAEYLSHTRTRACPVCAASPGTPWFSTQDGYRYDVCPRCGMVYIPDVVPMEIWDRYFAELSTAREWLIEQMNATIGPVAEQQNRARFTRYFDILSRLAAVEPGSRLLDVGTFTGASLRVAAERGVDAYGVEGLQEAVKFVHQYLPVLRVTLGHAESFAADVYGGGFGLVTFWETLEHTFDPRLALARAHAALAPGGLLAITVPNARNVQFSVLREHCYFAYGGYQGVGHLNLFTPATLARILEESGFEPVHVETEFGTDWRQVAHYLQHRFDRVYCYRNLVQHGEFEQAPGASLSIVLNWLSPALTRLENALLAGPILMMVARRR